LQRPLTVFFRLPACIHVIKRQDYSHFVYAFRNFDVKMFIFLEFFCNSIVCLLFFCAAPIKSGYCARFEVVKVLLMKFQVCGDVMPCHLLSIYECFSNHSFLKT
jgi:hypothetical protein